MNFLAEVITWINVPMNALGKVLLAPIGAMPGWLSNTVISAVAGIVLLILFKYTSNQSAIGRVRDNIKANMLALKLFKDSIVVTLQAQGRIFKGALLLLFYAIRPMLVMIVPVCLLFAQMGLWYQFRPLHPSEEAVITMTLNGEIDSPFPDVRIKPIAEVVVTTGPIRVLNKREIHWKIRAEQEGYHQIMFSVDDRQISKELAIGHGLMCISPERPGWNWADILLYPLEKPFESDSPVRSIRIEYPDRVSFTSGTNWWIGYFFVVSLIFALIFKPVFKVRI